MPKKIVLDFDGTLTDPWPDFERFEKAAKDYLESWARRPISKEWAEAKKLCYSNRAMFGWECDGHIVSGATDPYLICNFIVARVLWDIDLEHYREVPVDTFRAAYRPAPLKLGTELFLTEVCKRADAAVITNSDPEKVRRFLPPVEGLKVYGHAMKFRVDHEWQEVPDFQRLPGLRRPVLLRRKNYYDALQSARDGADWPDVAVVGDSYELDLALPQYLGAKVYLVESQGTLDYERTAVGEGGVVKGFDEIARKLFE